MCKLNGVEKRNVTTTAKRSYGLQNRTAQSYVGKLCSDPYRPDVRQCLYKLCACSRCTAVTATVDVPEMLVQSYLQTISNNPFSQLHCFSCQATLTASFFTHSKLVRHITVTDTYNNNTYNSQICYLLADILNVSFLVMLRKVAFICIKKK